MEVERPSDRILKVNVVISDELCPFFWENINHLVTYISGCTETAVDYTLYLL